MPSCGKSSGWRPALPRRHSIARCVDEQASVRLWSRSPPNFALSAAPPFLPSERGCIATEGPLDLATLALTSIRTSILSLADRPQFADGCNSRTGAARGRAPLHGLGPTWLAGAMALRRPSSSSRSGQPDAPLPGALPPSCADAGVPLPAGCRAGAMRDRTLPGRASVQSGHILWGDRGAKGLTQNDMIDPD